MEPYAEEIVSKYPNAYFTLDGPFWDISNEHKSVSLYGSGSKEEFVSDFKRDFDKVLNSALSSWKIRKILRFALRQGFKFLWFSGRNYKL